MSKEGGGTARRTPMDALRHQLAAALRDAAEAKRALRMHEASGRPRDTWKLQLTLRYARLPDVAGGVVPAAFVHHLETLLRTRLSLSFGAATADSLTMLHRGRWEGDHALVFEGIFVTRPGTDGSSVATQAWHGMPRHFRNLFTRERWPAAYRAWGHGLKSDSTEARRVPGMDGDRIFAMVSALDALHAEAHRSLDRMFDNATRRAAGHGLVERGRQAAVVLQRMTGMVDGAAHHKRALPHASGAQWLAQYTETLDTALRRAQRHGTRLDVGNLSARSATAEAMLGTMGALAARLRAGVGEVLAQRFRLERFVDALRDLERPWLRATPTSSAHTSDPSTYLAARAWWDRVSDA